MKKILLGVFVTVISLAMIINFKFFNLTSIAKAASIEDSQLITTDLDTNAMAFDHIKLDVPQSIPLIDSNTAIENAKKAFPDWAADAKQVKAEYHLVSNDTFECFSDAALNKNADLKTKKHMDKTPAYIVSFRGMTYYGHVPNGFKGNIPVHHEYNVIVDATSGEPLMGFSDR